MRSPIVDLIKDRVRKAMDDVLSSTTDGRTRRARVTVVRTVRRGARAGGTDTTLVRVYRLLEDLKTLVGDADRVVSEAKALFPKKAKRKPKASAKRRGGKKASAPGGRRKKRGRRSAEGATARVARGGRRRAAPAVERTTVDAETPVRRVG
jgi:hypothetical protein